MHSPNLLILDEQRQTLMMKERNQFYKIIKEEEKKILL